MHSRQTLNLNAFKTNNIQCIQTFICQICIFIFLCFLILGWGPRNEWQQTLSLLGCMWGPNQPRYRDQLKLSKLAGLINDSCIPAARQVKRVIIQPWVQLEVLFLVWTSLQYGMDLAPNMLDFGLPGPLRFYSFLLFFIFFHLAQEYFNCGWYLGCKTWFYMFVYIFALDFI